LVICLKLSFKNDFYLKKSIKLIYIFVFQCKKAFIFLYFFIKKTKQEEFGPPDLGWQSLNRTAFPGPL